MEFSVHTAGQLPGTAGGVTGSQIKALWSSADDPPVGNYFTAATPNSAIGSGSAHPIVQPTSFLNAMIKL